LPVASWLITKWTLRFCPINFEINLFILPCFNNIFRKALEKFAEGMPDCFFFQTSFCGLKIILVMKAVEYPI
jgi:hypothetical protein